MPQATKTIASPVGALTLVASNEGLVALLWEHDRPGRVALDALVEDQHHSLLLETECQLEAYFAGTRRNFDLVLDLAGTVFQKRVWEALLAIPYGATRSYLSIAKEIGSPKGSRAVGAAVGRNPVSIIVPCHRAVGSNGALTGFAGGLETKRHLLALESHRGAVALTNQSIAFDRTRTVRPTAHSAIPTVGL